MFKSQFSGKISQAGEKPVKLVIATRKRKYENYVNKELVVSYGTEIVKELLVLPSEVNVVKEKYRLKD